MIMATTYNHVQMGTVDAKGNINVMYPITTGEDVSIKRTNTKIPTSVTNTQELANKLGKMAFEDGDDVIFLGSSAEYDGAVVDSEIDDTRVSDVTTFSSSKIMKLINELKDIINSN